MHGRREESLEKKRVVVVVSDRKSSKGRGEPGAGGGGESVSERNEVSGAALHPVSVRSMDLPCG